MAETFLWKLGKQRTQGASAQAGEVGTSVSWTRLRRGAAARSGCLAPRLDPLGDEDTLGSRRDPREGTLCPQPWLLALPGRAGHGRPLRSPALAGTRRANEDAVMSVKPDGIAEITQRALAPSKGTWF